MNVDQSQAKRYVDQRLALGRTVTLLRHDLLRLEQAEKHARRLRDMRDGLAAELANADG